MGITRTHPGREGDLVPVAGLALDLKLLVMPRQVDLGVLGDRGTVRGEEGVEVEEEGVHLARAGRGDGEGVGKVEGLDGGRRDGDVLERGRDISKRSRERQEERRTLMQE